MREGEKVTDARMYGKILARLVEGENGTVQVPAVKRALRALEREGLVRWTQTPGCRSAGGGGWYLTEDGRAAIAGSEG